MQQGLVTWGGLRSASCRNEVAASSSQTVNCPPVHANVQSCKDKTVLLVPLDNLDHLSLSQCYMKQHIPVLL